MAERIKEAKNLNSLLLIYSKTDSWIPIEMGKRFNANSTVPSELWIVDEAEHAEIIKSKHKKAYLEKVLKYFNTESQKVILEK